MSELETMVCQLQQRSSLPSDLMGNPFPGSPFWLLLTKPSCFRHRLVKLKKVLILVESLKCFLMFLEMLTVIESLPVPKSPCIG